jgi:hypothetical protein
MPINYPRLERTANRLIRENGRPVTIERPAQGVFNATTGATDFGGGDGKPTRHETIGVLRNYETNFIDGSLIKANDRELLLDGRFKPEVTDRIFMDGKKVGDIVAPIKEVNPGGTVILYKIQIRI